MLYVCEPMIVGRLVVMNVCLSVIRGVVVKSAIRCGRTFNYYLCMEVHLCIDI